MDNTICINTNIGVLNNSNISNNNSIVSNNFNNSNNSNIPNSSVESDGIDYTFVAELQKHGIYPDTDHKPPTYVNKEELNKLIQEAKEQK